MDIQNKVFFLLPKKESGRNVTQLDWPLDLFLFLLLYHTHTISLSFSPSFSNSLALYLPLKKVFLFLQKKDIFGRESLLIEGEWHPETIPEQHLNTFWHFDKWQNKWKLWCCVSLSHKPDTKYLEHGTLFLSKTAEKNVTTQLLCMISEEMMSYFLLHYLSCSALNK